MNRKSIFRYCVSVSGNLASWKSKKQAVVCHLGVGSKCRVMVATSKLMWMSYLCQLGIKSSKSMDLWCDNWAAIHITINLIFHK